MSADHTRRLVLDMSAVTDSDLADKLIDLAHEIDAGKPPRQSVFASPSCSGTCSVGDIGGDAR